MTQWSEIPKTELHLHLEGAAPPEFIRTLAAEKGVDLSSIFMEDGAYKWTDFAEFLKTYEAATSILKSPDDFKRLVRAVLAKSAADGVVYTEIFLAPDFCGDASLGAWTEYLAAMSEGAEIARAEDGIETRFIATCVRHFGPDQARNTARLSAETAGGLLTGFGMGGEERHLSAAEFAPAFDMAREAGLGLTTHAGEICGPESVRDSIASLRPTRIGHGVRSIEDPALVEELAVRGIVLEVNPGSNVALDVYGDWAAHPIDILRKAGVPVTVSTDDPPYFRTDMAREYRKLSETFGWAEADFKAINRTAMQAAFCDIETRRRLLRLFE